MSMSVDASILPQAESTRQTEDSLHNPRPSIDMSLPQAETTQIEDSLYIPRIPHDAPEPMEENSIAEESVVMESNNT